MAPVLAVLAALALLAGLVTGYARLALFDSDGFSDRATAALDDDAVKAEIARRVTDDLVLNANADLVGFGPVIEDVVEGIVGAGIFQNLFRTAARDVHSAFFEGNRTPRRSRSPTSASSCAGRFRRSRRGSRRTSAAAPTSP